MEQRLMYVGNPNPYGGTYDQSTTSNIGGFERKLPQQINSVGALELAPANPGSIPNVNTGTYEGSGSNFWDFIGKVIPSLATAAGTIFGQTNTPTTGTGTTTVVVPQPTTQKSAIPTEYLLIGGGLLLVLFMKNNKKD